MTRRPVYDLQGELRSFPPSLLFQMLALGALGGRLLLRSPRGSSEVFFEHGRLVLARGPGRSERLGDELVRRGLVDRQRCELAARERERRGGVQRLGAILVASGDLPREDLERLVRDRIKATLCDVLEWREGRFTFEVGVRPDDEDIYLEVELDSLLLECMTRLDDARHREAGEPRA